MKKYEEVLKKIKNSDTDNSEKDTIKQTIEEIENSNIDVNIKNMIIQELQVKEWCLNMQKELLKRKDKRIKKLEREVKRLKKY